MEAPEDFKTLIRRLKALGAHVRFRNWAMGDTILVADKPREAGGITCYGRGFYLCRREGGEWFVSLSCDIGERLTEEGVFSVAEKLLNMDDASYEAETLRRMRLASGLQQEG